MVDRDVVADVTPRQKFNNIKGPTITELRTALAGAGVTAADLQTMTKNDLIYRARVQGVAVSHVVPLS